MSHTGDAADDPAIWVNQANPAQSAVIGTDKLGAIEVYDLDGRRLQSLPVGRANNVDVRSDLGDGTAFTLSGRPISLVTASNRTNNSIIVYEMDPVSRQLRDIAARTITTGIQVYGECMYRSPQTGTFYAFLTGKTGQVEQWALSDNGAGKVDATKVRSFQVTTTEAEGCVADDELGFFYVADEYNGIWKYGAEPGAGTARTSVGSASAAGPLAPTIEGLTIARTSSGTGLLMASSQGNDTFAVYRREGANAFVGSFRVVAANGIDAVSGTDGIDVTTANLGPAFPAGVFAAQDGTNDAGNQNFKLVPFQLIAAVGQSG